MSEKLTELETTSFINDVIKSIAKSSFGNKVIFDGSVAVFKMLLNLSKSDLILERQLSILDIDLDVYDDIQMIAKSDSTKSQIRKGFFNYLNENFVQVLLNSNYFTGVELLEVNIAPKRVKDSQHKLYVLEFKIMLEKEFNTDRNKKEHKRYTLNIDIVVLKEILPFNQKKIVLDDEIITVNVYEIEKYFAGKILSGLTHLKHYEDLKSKGINNFRVSENLNKVRKVINDIHLFEDYLNISTDKLKYYFKILSDNKQINSTDVMGAIDVLEKYQKE